MEGATKTESVAADSLESKVDQPAPLAWEPRGPEYGERLCRAITGLSVDDPTLPARLLEDRAAIRAKYDLPDDPRSISLSLYEQRLRRWIEEEGSFLRSKADRERYFDAHPGAGAAYSRDSKAVYADVNLNAENGPRGLGQLEHEAIHAAQSRHFPGMPIEVMEYEAYVANFSTKTLRDSARATPELFTTFFQHMVGASVDMWYRSESKSRGEIVRPKWNEPDSAKS